MPPKTSDVATKTPGTVEKTKFEKFIEFANARAELDASFATADELAVQQINKIVDAESLEDLYGAMKAQGLTGLRDLENGTELEIREYRLVRSANAELSGRTGVFAVVNAVNTDTGEDLALDTSIERILGFLLKCDQLEAYPVRVRVEKKTTMAGNTMITFVKPPVRAAKS